MALILLVDDDDDVREAFCQALRRRGHEVMQATDGREGLQLLQDGLRPSLIILDNDMPVLDGEGFRAAQLAEPAIARIPVLLVTANVAIEDLASAMRPVGIVQKPVGFTAFLSTVDLVLRRMESAAAAHA